MKVVSLFRKTIVAEVYHALPLGKTERSIVEYENFREAKRDILNKMFDRKSNVYGANFKLKDGVFLKEIIL